MGIFVINKKNYQEINLANELNVREFQSDLFKVLHS